MDWTQLRRAAYDLTYEAINSKDILTHPFRYNQKTGRSISNIFIEGHHVITHRSNQI